MRYYIIGISFSIHKENGKATNFFVTIDVMQFIQRQREIFIHGFMSSRFQAPLASIDMIMKIVSGILSCQTRSRFSVPLLRYVELLCDCLLSAN